MRDLGRKLGFNEQCYHFGSVADTALIIGGLTLLSSAPVVGQVLIAGGALSLFARKFSTVFGML